MALLLALLAADGTARPIDKPRSFLLSLINLPVGRDDYIDRFEIETWGIEYRTVCRIPYGWRITAGNSLTPNGELTGAGSQGSTWFRQASPPALRDFVLVTLEGPIQREDEGDVIPATFKGRAYVLGTDDDESKAVLIDYRQVRLTPAARCPDV